MPLLLALQGSGQWARAKATALHWTSAFQNQLHAAAGPKHKKEACCQLRVLSVDNSPVRLCPQRCCGAGSLPCFSSCACLSHRLEEPSSPRADPAAVAPDPHCLPAASSSPPSHPHCNPSLSAAIFSWCHPSKLPTIPPSPRRLPPLCSSPHTPLPGVPPAALTLQATSPDTSQTRPHLCSSPRRCSCSTPQEPCLLHPSSSPARNAATNTPSRSGGGGGTAPVPPPTPQAAPDPPPPRPGARREETGLAGLHKLL